MGRALILVGIVCIAIGIALVYAPWLLTWFGRLPCDIRFESGKTRVYIPITSMIVVSIVLSLIMQFFKR